MGLTGNLVQCYDQTRCERPWRSVLRPRHARSAVHECCFASSVGSSSGIAGPRLPDELISAEVACASKAHNGVSQPTGNKGCVGVNVYADGGYKTSVGTECVSLEVFCDATTRLTGGCKGPVLHLRPVSSAMHERCFASFVDSLRGIAEAWRPRGVAQPTGDMVYSFLRLRVRQPESVGSPSSVLPAG